MKNIFTTLLMLAMLSLCSRSLSQNFWEQTNGPNGGDFRSFAINSSGHIFAATYGSVFRSTDNGENWTQVRNGLPENYLMDLVINSNGHIFAATYSNSVFRSTNNGDNWVLKNNGLPSRTTSLAINSNGYILTGTVFGGVYRGLNSTITIAKNHNVTPSTLLLEQNYPNPFNPSTKIRFTNYELRFTSLKVYDVLGNEIATLVNEEKPAGSYEVEFSVGQNSILSLSSGIYFYQLKAGSFIQTRKMILLR